MISGHGDDIYSYDTPIVSNFSSNVFYGADLSGLHEHLRQCISCISNYPEPEPYSLEKEIAAYHHIPDACACVTNGATEAIYLIAQAFKGAKSAILSPTFSEYADACRLHNHRVTFVYAPENIPEETEIMWLCNPNNPTGTVIDKEILINLISRNPHIYFVIDQAYGYFTSKEIFTPQEALNYPNVIQLHSMTKRYAIAGLRLGYMVASSSLIKHIQTQRMPWSVNQLAIEAGFYLLRNEIPNRIHINAYLQEAQNLKKDLAATGAVEVWETDTHFMLARLRTGKASALKDYLVARYGFLIRDASNFEGLSNDFFRIAAQTPHENTQLIKYISEWLAL